MIRTALTTMRMRNEDRKRLRLQFTIANHGTQSYIRGAGAGAGAGTYLHSPVRTRTYLHVRTFNSPVSSSNAGPC